MKKYLAILLISLTLIAGCKSSNEQIQQTSITSTVSSPDDVTNCPKDRLRKEVKEDGSIVEYCLPPEYFNLKPCSTNKDCNSAEYCFNDYCRSLE